MEAYVKECIPRRLFSVPRDSAILHDQSYTARFVPQVQLSTTRSAPQKLRPPKPLTCGKTWPLTRSCKKTVPHARFLVSKRPWFIVNPPMLLGLRDLRGIGIPDDSLKTSGLLSVWTPCHERPMELNKQPASRTQRAVKQLVAVTYMATRVFSCVSAASAPVPSH